MPRAEKLSIGILFNRPNFELQTNLGKIAEAIISKMDGKSLPKEFFQEVSVQNGVNAQFKSLDNTKYLLVEANNIVYTRDHYNQPHTADYQTLENEFSVIWNTVNQLFKLHEISRIGIVSEYRVIQNDSKPSAELLARLTNLPVAENHQKFVLQYETQYPVNKKKDFSITHDEFVNVIEQFYDSVGDLTHPVSGYKTFLLDVQHYYKPILESKRCLEELLKLRGQFIHQEVEFKNKLKKLGLLNE